MKTILGKMMLAAKKSCKTKLPIKSTLLLQYMELLLIFTHISLFNLFLGVERRHDKVLTMDKHYYTKLL